MSEEDIEACVCAPQWISSGGGCMCWPQLSEHDAHGSPDGYILLMIPCPRWDSNPD